ncbi:MAG: hypothetical protein ABGY41_21880, partial [Candidatus Poribacteria bacterium]
MADPQSIRAGKASRFGTAEGVLTPRWQYHPKNWRPTITYVGFSPTWGSQSLTETLAEGRRPWFRSQRGWHGGGCVTTDGHRLQLRPTDHARVESLSAYLARRDVQAYLVGGAIRDALLGRHVEDVDIAVPVGAMRPIQAWARRQGRPAISLHNAPPTRRVTFEDGFVIDIAAFRGETLEEDLRLRDFTVNAIAAPFEVVSEDLTGVLIDPCGGVEDLRLRRLRECSARSLDDDPLRMLRAFRLSATHSLRIYERTLTGIRERVSKIDDVAWERVREEFMKLLATGRSYASLRAMDGIGLLERLLPEITAMKGAPQNRFHHLDVWEHTLDAIDRFEREPVPPTLGWLATEFSEYLSENRGQATPMVALLKSALLLHDCAKPTTRTVDESGRVRFRSDQKPAHAAGRPPAVPRPEACPCC